MLTARENFMETIKGGKPDRFVKPFEYQEWLNDSLFPVYFGNIVPGTEWINGWGVKNIFPVGMPGPFPSCEGEDKVCKDIAKWKEYVKAPEVVLSAEAWKEAVAQAESIDRKEKFVTAKIFCGVFEKLHYLMGMEDAMINFYDEPEAMHELIDYLTAWEIEEIINLGMIPYVFLEGPYNTRLEILKQVPKGKVIYMFEQVDIAKAKKILGDTACICGNLPSADLIYGKKEDIIENTKRMLDICAPGGGFMMDCSIVIDHYDEEKFSAWYETTLEYGRY